MPAPVTSFKSKTNDSKYDNPSLSDEEDSYGSSERNMNVATIGYPDGVAPLSTDWKTSKIGGLPIFPPFKSLHSLPSPPHTSCTNCQKPAPLLVQIYCPLEGSDMERVLYVWGCVDQGCRGKTGRFRIWRASLPWSDKDKETKQLKDDVEVGEVGTKMSGLGLGSLVFGSGDSTAEPGSVHTPTSANPFASTPISNPFVASNPFAPSNPFSSNPFASPLTPTTTEPIVKQTPEPKKDSSAQQTMQKQVEDKSEGWPKDSTPYFTPQYISTDFDTPSNFSNSKLDKKYNLHLHDLDLEMEGGKHRENKGKGARNPKKKNSGADEGWGQESYEVQKIAGVDEQFLAFQEAVYRGGGTQVIRYNPHLTPLPFSSHSTVFQSMFTNGIFDTSRTPACKNCGGRSMCELQLMPFLNEVLGKSKAYNVNGGGREGLAGGDLFDFATVIVFSCVGECTDSGEEGWREEKVYDEVEV